MKILFYNHTGQVSGAEYLLLMILARLDRDRFQPLVLCPERGPLQQRMTDLGVPAETVSGLDARFTFRGDQLLRYLKSFFLVVRDVRRKVVTIKPDLIHANSIRAGLVATAATLNFKTRVVWHLHDLLPRHPVSSVIRAYAFLSQRTRMLAVSEAVADNFRGTFFPLKSRVNVILNAIDLEKFQPNPAARQETHDLLRLGDAEPVIGIVGQLTPRKGQLELVGAFARVLSKMPRAMLLIVGAPLFNRDEDYAKLIKQTTHELGIEERVRLTGARTDVSAVMQALDLLVVNSSIEPFGLVALEAMACNTPVLAAVSGGIPEIIEHGRNGWLIPQGDEQALAGAILYLGRQPAICSKLAEQGKRHVASRFSAGRYLVDLQAFYSAICDGKIAAEKDSAIAQTEATEFA